MSTPAHACAPALDDRPVLATAPLKAGHAREELSRVGDPSWDLGPAVFRENARRCHVTVHFDVLEHADVQAAMRAYLYARLNVDLPGYGAKLPPASIRQAFNRARRRSEEHTSELQSLMRISYAVFCLKKKTTPHTQTKTNCTTYTAASHETRMTRYNNIFIYDTHTN